MQYSSDCQVGGGDMGGFSLRHLIMAKGMKTKIGDYNYRYAHSTPSVLDPYVFSHFTMESYEETLTWPSNVQFGLRNYDSRNEPDPVCHCVGSEDNETANYPHVGSYSDYKFQEISQVPFPTSTNFLVEISAVLNLKIISTRQSYD
jgi:hypothetical protein